MYIYTYIYIYTQVILVILFSFYKVWYAVSLLFVGISNKNHCISTSFYPSWSGQEQRLWFPLWHKNPPVNSWMWRIHKRFLSFSQAFSIGFPWIYSNAKANSSPSRSPQPVNEDSLDVAVPTSGENRHGRFPQIGGTPKWMVYNGKSY